MAFVEGDEFFDVYVGNSVPVREHEGIVSYVFSCTEDPPSCLGSKSGVNQGDFPGFTVLFMDGHLVVFKIEGDVAAVEEVVGEIFFDDVSFVSQKNDKIVVSIPGVDLHDMPENRMASDLHHGFWDDICLFGKACAHAACEDKDFHFSFLTYYVLYLKFMVFTFISVALMLLFRYILQ